MRKIILVVSLAAALTACSTNKRHANPMAEMTPQEIMAKVEQAGTPGTEHAKLEPLVGEWNIVSKWWTEPGKDPLVDKGTATHQWINGKRFVKEDYNGKWFGKPYHGMGLLGYDNAKGSYVSTWIDNANTGIMTGEGDFNTAKNELDMTSSGYCPVTEGTKETRMVTRIINKNKHILEMYDLDPEGNEMKVMEITYTRKG